MDIFLRFHPKTHPHAWLYLQEEKLCNQPVPHSCQQYSPDNLLKLNNVFSFREEFLLDCKFDQSRQMRDLEFQFHPYNN